MATVFVLMEEVSDQYGTSEPLSVFSTRAKADKAGEQVILRRTFVKELDFDPELLSDDALKAKFGALIAGTKVGWWAEDILRFLNEHQYTNVIIEHQDYKSLVYSTPIVSKHDQEFIRDRVSFTVALEYKECPNT